MFNALKKLIIAILFLVGAHTIYTFIRTVIFVGKDPSRSANDAAEYAKDVAAFRE